jgi:hypothetical protein
MDYKTFSHNNLTHLESELFLKLITLGSGQLYREAGNSPSSLFRDGSGYLFGCQIFGLLSSIVNK